MYACLMQTFQRLQGSPIPAATSSTPSKPPVEVYESDPVPDAEEGAWQEVTDRLDPQGALAG